MEGRGWEGGVLTRCWRPQSPDDASEGRPGGKGTCKENIGCGQKNRKAKSLKQAPMRCPCAGDISSACFRTSRHTGVDGSCKGATAALL